MRRIAWLDSAVNDIKRLREFVAKENPSAAKKVAGIVKAATQRLIETPLLSKPVKDLSPYRDSFARFGAGGYVIRYRTYSEIIYIVHIRHYRESDFNIE